MGDMWDGLRGGGRSLHDWLVEARYVNDEEDFDGYRDRRRRHPRRRAGERTRNAPGCAGGRLRAPGACEPGDPVAALIGNRRYRRMTNEKLLRELAGPLDASDMAALFAPPPFGFERQSTFEQLADAGCARLFIELGEKDRDRLVYNALRRQRGRGGQQPVVRVHTALFEVRARRDVEKVGTGLGEARALGPEIKGRGKSRVPEDVRAELTVDDILFLCDMGMGTRKAREALRRAAERPLVASLAAALGGLVLVEDVDVGSEIDVEGGAEVVNDEGKEVPEGGGARSRGGGRERREEEDGNTDSSWEEVTDDDEGWVTEIEHESEGQERPLEARTLEKKGNDVDKGKARRGDTRLEASSESGEGASSVVVAGRQSRAKLEELVLPLSDPFDRMLAHAMSQVLGLRSESRDLCGERAVVIVASGK